MVLLVLILFLIFCPKTLNVLLLIRTVRTFNLTTIFKIQALCKCIIELITSAHIGASSFSLLFGLNIRHITMSFCPGYMNFTFPYCLYKIQQYSHWGLSPCGLKPRITSGKISCFHPHITAFHSSCFYVSTIWLKCHTHASIIAPPCSQTLAIHQSKKGGTMGTTMG